MWLFNSLLIVSWAFTLVAGEVNKTPVCSLPSVAIQLLASPALFVPLEVNEQESPVSTPTVTVYLLGGQSNMQGLGKVAELPEPMSREIPHAFFWNGQTFEPLVLGQTKVSARANEFGPEVGFALEMASETNPVYLVKYHASGMPLHHGWNGNVWEGGEPVPGRRNFYPGETPNDENCGTLYAAMRDQFQAALEHLSQSEQTPVVRGFVWMQGEQDSKDALSATSYAASLNRLRRRLAEDLHCEPTLPLAFGQVLPYTPPLERFKFRDEIRAQMAACDCNSGSPEAMPATIMVSTDDISLLPDTVHYDTQGQLRLGEAFAKAIKQIHSAGVEVRSGN